MNQITTINRKQLQNIGKYNVIVGRNGAGKSDLLRDIEQTVRNNQSELNIGNFLYVTPERGGVLTPNTGVEQNIVSNINYIKDSRRKNQVAEFKQQTFVRFKLLKSLIHDEIEDKIKQDEQIDSLKESLFEHQVKKVNDLLEKIKIKQGSNFIEILDKNDQPIDAPVISSGESELIALAIETIVFTKEIVAGKENIILFDEPDVHLHPDLQVKFMNFIVEETKNLPIQVFIATHSTPILYEIGKANSSTVLFLNDKDQLELTFNQIEKYLKKILPIFGAHPLSQVFNDLPLLLVEGGDEVRIWQKAIRKSNGDIKLYPIDCGGIPEMRYYESEVVSILPSIYENPRAYSLYDRDDNEDQIDDKEFIVRFRLGCRASENLLLTDEVLSGLGTSWEELKTKIEAWLEIHNDDDEKPRTYDVFKAFAEDGFDRKRFDLKNIRNDLLSSSFLSTYKTWEILVGCAIANYPEWKDSTDDHSIKKYLGEKLISHIFNEREN